LQDGSNFVTFGALSDTTANTAAIATVTAAATTNQSGIAAVNASIASILAGNSALETLNVFNETVGGSNTLEIKNKPDALNTASLQIEHELTTSAQQAKVNFWDTSIPNSASTNSATALTLSWDGDADTHTSTFAGGLTVAGTMACTNLICTGIATMPGSGASAGDLLKVSRTLLTQGSTNVPTNQSRLAICNYSHTPSDSSSYLDITLTATWKLMLTGGSGDGGWRISIFVDNVSQGDCILSSNTNANLATGSSSPCFGRYTKSSLTTKTISIRVRLTTSAPSRVFFLSYDNYGLKPNWLSVEVVKR
jgi:hypothetical protein